MKSLLVLLIVIILILAGAGFYWFGWRPNYIIRSCNIEAETKAIESAKRSNRSMQELYAEAGMAPMQMFPDKFALPEIKDPYYEECLREHGLVK